MSIGSIVADATKAKKAPMPMEVPDDLMALSKKIEPEVDDKTFIRDWAKRTFANARINKDGTLRAYGDTKSPGFSHLKQLMVGGDLRAVTDALNRADAFSFTKDGSGAGGTGTLVEALTKPGWQHSGRQVKIVNMSPTEYLARSAAGHGLDYDELLAQLGQGDRTQNILKGIFEGESFAMPYLDYRNGSFGQEGQHRAMAAAMLGKEKIPVAVMWTEEAGSSTKPTSLAAAGAAVGLSQPDGAQAGTNPQGTSSMAQIASQTAPLLDKIGELEGNSRYDIEFGGGKIDLPNMTIEQVLKHQEDQRQKGAKSTAVGKYQFIYKTLEELVRRNPKDFPKDRKFDKATQDELAAILLKRRGLDKYLAGNISKEEFAKNLSKEWASLPNPDTGKSYYDGDGLNHSLMGKDDLVKLIESIK